MDDRVEALLADLLALEGEDPIVIRDGVRGALADYEQLFRAQEVNKLGQWACDQGYKKIALWPEFRGRT